jgi:hypothetical protein
MKRPAVRWFLLLLLGGLLVGVSGCVTSEAGNDSVRPWNTPQSWEGSMPMMGQQQH